MFKKVIVLVVLFLIISSNICLAKKQKICEITFVNGETDEYYIFKMSETKVWAVPYKTYKSTYNPYSFREVFEKKEISTIKCGDSFIWNLSKEMEEFKEYKDKLGMVNWNYLQYLSEKREPATAGLFSLLMVGGGQFYNKQPGKGAFMVLGQIVVIVFIVRDDIPWYTGFGMPIISFFDSIASADRINRQLRKKYDIMISTSDQTTYLRFHTTF